MITKTDVFEAKIADGPEEVAEAQNLRYRVFVQELGGDGPMVDHAAQLERDHYDDYFEHLILRDHSKGGEVVGVYRLLRGDRAEAAGQFYSEDEYDLSVLKNSGRKLLELGRSCLAKEYRGGAAMYHMWQALAAYVAQHRIEVLFGVASFHGTDAAQLAAPLSMLHHRHLAPPALRVRARAANFQTMDLIPEADLDRRAAMLQVPALIKAYLRLGGHVGEGAYVDHAFNTTDICLIMDTQNLRQTQANIYTKDQDK